MANYRINKEDRADEVFCALIGHTVCYLDEKGMGHAVGFAFSNYLESAALVQSPIEKICAAILSCALDPAGGYVWIDGAVVDKFCPLTTFHCQEEIIARDKKYRVDFLVRCHATTTISKAIVIECDGHDFHERTKEQAKRDRSRDRALTEAGYKVLRFTGSELFTTPYKCSDEIEAAIAGSMAEAKERSTK